MEPKPLDGLMEMRVKLQTLEMKLRSNLKPAEFAQYGPQLHRLKATFDQVETTQKALSRLVLRLKQSEAAAIALRNDMRCHLARIVRYLGGVVAMPNEALSPLPGGSHIVGEQIPEGYVLRYLEKGEPESASTDAPESDETPPETETGTIN